jgi:outer membrane biosynthesis protein TonB
MTDALVDVLAERALEPKGLDRIVAVSFGVHVGAIVVALLVSRVWVNAEKTAPKLMTITLTAGAEGPKSTGMTALGARPVEQVASPPKRPEPIKPVPPKNDAMTVPVKPKPEPKPEFKPKSIEPPKPPPLSERPPTTGRQVTAGTSRVETNTKSQGTGLSTGGTLGGAQDVVQIDPEFKFCCQSYIDSMCEIIQRYWNKDQQTNGDVVLVFTILRDGRITDIKTDRAFNSRLERFARSAIDTSQSMGGFGRLPDEFKGDKLVVHLRFPYIR